MNCNVCVDYIVEKISSINGFCILPPPTYLNTSIFPSEHNNNGQTADDDTRKHQNRSTHHPVKRYNTWSIILAGLASLRTWQTFEHPYSAILTFLALKEEWILCVYIVHRLTYIHQTAASVKSLIRTLIKVPADLALRKLNEGCRGFISWESIVWYI